MLEQQIRTFKTEVAGKEIIIETGRLAEQAGGSVTVRFGDTMLFCATTMSQNVRDGQDFFPLTVEFEERLYAVGRIPGSFMRREGKPSEQSILSSRVVDRTLRPLFNKDMLNEVQVIIMTLSHDQEYPTDMLGILAASTALMISDIPWEGPVAGARIGLIDGQLIVNPSIKQMEQSSLDLRVSGTEDAINMVECGANEVNEETMIKALDLAQETIKQLVAVQKEMRAAIGKETSPFQKFVIEDELMEAIRTRCQAQVREIVLGMTDRDDRNDAMDEVRNAVVAEYEAHNAALTAEQKDQAVNLKKVKQSVDAILKEEVRKRIVHEGVRPDGRDFFTIRPLSAMVGFVPRVHGSGLFKRGQTQVLTIATLGTPRDSQLLDGIDPEDSKRYMHHYNFPPYSTGEAAPMRGPKRREIGHGALAENALVAMIPNEHDFPYTIRLVSEVMSSNGSTSMASVCGSTLALMDAGVPIKRPVAGIAMGLIKHDDKVAVLTDIQGLEDHLGDMDFKVAGTSEGITALQMDIKIKGVSGEIMRQALAQALTARMQILEVITNAIAAPREELSKYAPRMVTIKIPVDKIGAVIGPGGKTIRAIQESTNTTIEIAEDGTTYVAGNDSEGVEQAIFRVRGLVEDAELGQIYTGKITRLENFGAFVEFLPGKEGLVHVSQLADHRVENPTTEFNLGEELMVMVIDVDPTGKVRLSRQAVLEGWSLAEAREKDRATSRGGGNRSGGGGDRRPGGGGNGGDRRGGSGGGDRRPSGGGGDRRGGNDRDRR
jgi:polyribonucleotide nucleotidyltransferase